MKTVTRSLPRAAALATSATAAALLLAACSQAPEKKPINYYEVRMEATARAPNECSEAVAIRLEPVQLAAPSAGSLYETRAYSDQPTVAGRPVEDGTGNWECWFDYRTRDLAPGTWRFVGEFAGGEQSCVREVGPGRPNRVRIDQEDGCGEIAR